MKESHISLYLSTSSGSWHIGGNCDQVFKPLSERGRIFISYYPQTKWLWVGENLTWLQLPTSCQLPHWFCLWGSQDGKSQNACSIYSSCCRNKYNSFLFLGSRIDESGQCDIKWRSHSREEDSTKLNTKSWKIRIFQWQQRAE